MVICRQSIVSLRVITKMFPSDNGHDALNWLNPNQAKVELEIFP